MNEPLLVDIKELSALLRRSQSALFRDDRAGRMPAPVRIGSAKRWRLDEIRGWVEAGMPSRAVWERRE